MDLHKSFRLGRWTVNPSHSSLWDGEATTHVEPKVMGVLVALASRNGNVVTRDEFIQEVWMGRVVSDEVLSRCISLLRSALHDNPREPEYIQTVPRIGYRLVAPVEPVEQPTATREPEAAENPDTPAKQVTVGKNEQRGSRRRYLAELQRRNIFRVAAGYAVIAWVTIEVTAAVLPSLGAPGWVHRVLTVLIVLGWPAALILTWIFEITPGGLRLEREVRKRERVTRIRGRKLDYVILSALAVGFLYLIMQRWTNPDGPATGPGPDVPTLAVLPFVNVSQNPDDDYFSDGLTEELINAFSRVEDLRVIARTSSFTYKDHSEDIREIGRKLGAQSILEGSVRKSGDEIRIAARLVDGEKGHQLWSETYEGRLEEIFALQDRITGAIVREMLPKLKERGALKQVAAERPTGDLQAYELFLRGRAQLRRRDEAPIRKSIELFRQAVDRDPDFAAAYVELATAYALLPYYSYELEDEMFAQARELIAMGTDRNPEVEAAAQGVLAFMSFRSWRWVDAEYSFRRALLSSPGDSNLHQWYSQFLASVRQLDGSMFHAIRAKELDPLSPVVNDRLAVAYLWTDQDDQAERQFELATELGMAPSANPEGHLVSLLRRGEYERAGKILETMQQMFGRPTEWIETFLAGLQDEAARPAAIEAIAAEGERGGISRGHLFGAWLYLGETDRAMALAFQLIRAPATFDVEFLFSREAAAFRAHPRFPELVRIIGLDKHWEEFGMPAICASEEGDSSCG
jgi:TolB-like protein/DNA-binding winged helix-turn-helix (wHTH) protein/Tfp pilus assembly protein PilF